MLALEVAFSTPSLLSLCWVSEGMSLAVDVDGIYWASVGALLEVCLDVLVVFWVIVYGWDDVTQNFWGERERVGLTWEGGYKRSQEPKSVKQTPLCGDKDGFLQISSPKRRYRDMGNVWGLHAEYHWSR
jgi:hypothetical protein